MNDKDIGKRRYVAKTEELEAKNKRIAKDVEAASRWRAATEPKQYYDKKDYVRRKIFQYLTLGIGPAVAEKREESLNELRKLNGQREVDALFAYALSTPVDMKDLEQKKAYDEKMETVLEMIKT